MTSLLSSDLHHHGSPKLRTVRQCASSTEAAEDWPTDLQRVLLLGV
jgi:hypothetical protein